MDGVRSWLGFVDIVENEIELGLVLGLGLGCCSQGWGEGWIIVPMFGGVAGLWLQVGLQIGLALGFSVGFGFQLVFDWILSQNWVWGKCWGPGWGTVQVRIGSSFVVRAGFGFEFEVQFGVQWRSGQFYFVLFCFKLDYIWNSLNSSDWIYLCRIFLNYLNFEDSP